MSQPEKNIRLRRTQKLLREALIALIEERGFDALTIGELTARALVSRAAFYRNYQDKYDLVEQIFAEAMSELLNAVGDLGREHPAEVWVAFFERIASDERLYRALLGSTAERVVRSAICPVLLIPPAAPAAAGELGALGRAPEGLPRRADGSGSLLLAARRRHGA